MGSFTGNLQYTYLDDGKAVITETVKFYLYSKNGNYLELPLGYVVNFATIPKILQWLFPVDHEDYKMAAAFHDGMVGEWMEPIWVKTPEGRRLHILTWQEAAYWFRVMIQIRQKVRRNNRVWWKKFLGVIPDFVTKWVFWVAVSFYGFIREK